LLFFSSFFFCAHALLCCARAQGAAGLSLPEGVKLKEALAALVEEMGWADLAERTGKN
jgi:hypothetical protein